MPTSGLRIDGLGRGENRLRFVERIAHLARGERLQKIIVNPAGDQIAIQTHVVDLAHGDHDGPRFAHFGERVDIGQRVAAFGKIDHQDIGAGRNRERLDRVAQATFGAFFRRPAQFRDDRPQRIDCGVVAQEGGEGIAIA